ncbi:hypothetical protein FJ527_26485 [Mesorhizobium sp. B2-4-18]|uniref:hypothetical protein n=1 Tax=Mesorhizobium sp. B2-4-18 TaxID=2589931 RepID=UPI00112D89CE|nr:hypothetical protein [Mesorhizobium sp. B2-4-18]TPK71592.1 hypothetical protein FJ527_26485 [Mesorhizobium sp. B2-4-18]
MTKLNPTETDRLRAALRLPAPTAEYVAAEKAYREASDARRKLNDRRQALEVESKVDNPTRSKIPAQQLHDTLKGLAVELSEADTRNHETRAEFDLQRAGYREQARVELDADIAALGAAINQRLSEVLGLLDVASTLSIKGREAGLELPGLINDAPIARRLAEPFVNTIAKMISKG